MTNDRIPAGPRRAAHASLLALVFAINSSGSDAAEQQIHGGITTVYQQELETGDDDISASGDLALTLPTNSGRWYLYIEGATGIAVDSIFNRYPEINGDAGSVQDRDSGGHVQVSELFYEFRLGASSFLTIGQIDASAHIDRSTVANDENTQFVGNSFINNATIQFPDYTVGAIYRRAAARRLPELTVIVSASDGIADIPSRSYRDLVDVSADGNGIFAAIGARWSSGKTEFGAGAWARTDEQPRLGDSASTNRNFGAFVVYDYAFGAQSVNVRAGIANSSVSRPAGFASIAYQLEQQRGVLGIGLARIFESSAAHQSTTGDTTHAEVWYRLPLVADSLHLTANGQYVNHPGFDRSGVTAAANALIAGLRLDFVF